MYGFQERDRATNRLVLVFIFRPVPRTKFPPRYYRAGRVPELEPTSNVETISARHTLVEPRLHASLSPVFLAKQTVSQRFEMTNNLNVRAASKARDIARNCPNGPRDFRRVSWSPVCASRSGKFIYTLPSRRCARVKTLGKIFNVIFYRVLQLGHRVRAKRLGQFSPVK